MFTLSVYTLGQGEAAWGPAPAYRSCFEHPWLREIKKPLVRRGHCLDMNGPSCRHKSLRGSLPALPDSPLPLPPPPQVKGRPLSISGSQSVFPVPVVSASPGNLLEMPTLGPRPVQSVHLALGDSDAHQSLRATAVGRMRLSVTLPPFQYLSSPFSDGSQHWRSVCWAGRAEGRSRWSSPLSADVRRG